MSTGDTVGIYCGEFLVSPIPLEMSFNYCSHKCSYCFANLNKPDRWFDAQATMTFVKNVLSGKGRMAANLARLGYPILASNRTDPFATRNYLQSVPVMRTLLDSGIPLAFQTRGGKGIEDILADCAPSVWYVSICQARDDLRRTLEPGAPTIESRWKLIETLKNAGHKVVLGINPLVPSWIEDIEAFVGLAAKHGVDAAWLGWLHFNHDQVSAMSDRERNALNDVIPAAMKRHPTQAVQQHIDRAVEACKSHGIKWFVSGQYPEYGGLWSVYHETYEKTFPTCSEFIEAVRRHPEAGESPVIFDEFLDYMLERLPEVSSKEMRDYIRIKREVRMSGDGEAANWRDVLKTIWNHSAFHQSPAKNDKFAVLAEADEDGWYALLDEDGNQSLVFSETGFDSQFAEMAGYSSK